MSAPDSDSVVFPFEGHPNEPTRHAPAPRANRWTYSADTATLLRDDAPFAILSPDGRNTFSDAGIRPILDALNGAEALRNAAQTPDGVLWKDISEQWRAKFEQAERRIYELLEDAARKEATP